MANVIWKFNLAVKSHQEINLPKGFKILNLQTQFESPTFWAMVDDDPDPNEMQTVRFATFNTGDTYEPLNQMEYVGTYQMSAGNYVYHVFYYIVS